jgi:hypothetical protein
MSILKMFKTIIISDLLKIARSREGLNFGKPGLVIRLDLVHGFGFKGVES